MTLQDSAIRPLRLEDAQDSYEIRTQPQVMWGTLQLPTLSLEHVRAQLAAGPDLHRLGIEVDGKIVGTVVLRVGGGAQRHSGTLGISVHDAYQGRGLGKRLMSAALDLADNALGLHRVGLEVYPDNARAVALYRSFGFGAEGASRQDVMRDGALVDSLHMGRVHQPAHAESAAPPARVQAAPLHGLQIRGARSEDVRAILRFYRQPSVLAGLGLLPTHHEDDVRKAYCPVPRDQHLLVAELDGEVIGMVHMTQAHGRRNHVGQIETLIVDPGWQGRGAGSALLQAVVDLGERWLGLRRLQARTINPAAVALLQKHGFALEATNRQAFYVGGRFVDAHLLGRLHTQA